MSISTKCFTYQYLIDNFTLQYYLVKCLPTRYRKYITNICLSSHNLAIETGRYNSVRDRNRLCFICPLEIEEEFHFVLKCPLYIDLRNNK